MSDNEIYTRMCVRYGWTEQEQEERRRRAAAMQEKLLRSIVKRSIESCPGAGLPVPCPKTAVEGFPNNDVAGGLDSHDSESLLA